MRILHCNTLVVGAGAAGLNAADELKKAGVDVLLLCDDFKNGTSRNAGSDKQTYYKLGLSGSEKDSVLSMAESLFQGGSMHGDHAYAMAALSAKCFLKLAQLGVPFPHNEWGEYVGYQTDHDRTQRATSAGPLTSRMMVECLNESVTARSVRREDGLTLLALLTDGNNSIMGAFLHGKDEFVAVNARHVILCTGGAALAYGRVVFPERQSGASGTAIHAGAKMSNLCYWQYGMASLDVRWNVSGSYQQVVPCYTDGQKEVLPEFFADQADMINSVFLKGYQWPFDAGKLNGSSRVDRAVAMINACGGHVYMDFTREPDGGVMNVLGEEGMKYLRNCKALQSTPIERLKAMNRKAYEFYAERGIDLAQKPLEVSICAQHSNGGIAIDRWWQTSINGLYAAGECAGAFGMYRPGGSALNETQVGSLRAAMHIAAHDGHLEPRSVEEFLKGARKDLQRESNYFNRESYDGQAVKILNEFRKHMDNCAGAMRDTVRMREMLDNVKVQLSKNIAGRTPEETAEVRDTLLVQRDMLSAMLCQSEYSGNAGHGFANRIVTPDAPAASDYAFETLNGETKAVPVRPLPESGGWFETVWKCFMNGEVFD